MKAAKSVTAIVEAEKLMKPSAGTKITMKKPAAADIMKKPAAAEVAKKTMKKPAAEEPGSASSTPVKEDALDDAAEASGTPTVSHIRIRTPSCVYAFYTIICIRVQHHRVYTRSAPVRRIQNLVYTINTLMCIRVQHHCSAYAPNPACASVPKGSLSQTEMVS